MGKRIEQLENLIRLWEDQQFLTKMLYTVEGLSRTPPVEVGFSGPTANFEGLRNHIVKNAQSGNFDYRKFVNSEEKIDVLSSRGLVIPPALFSWNRYSRRVFHITRDLQTLLSATSLDGIDWSEVQWPFRSFLLVLDEPLEYLGNRFSSILVTEIGSIIAPIKHTTRLSFMFLSENLETYKPLDRAKIIQRATPRKWDQMKMARKLSHIEGDFYEGFDFVVTDGAYKISGPIMGLLSSSSIPEPEPVSGSAEATTDDSYVRYSLFEKALHLVVSVCMYLSTLPPKKFPDDWQPREKEMEPIGEYNPAAITTPNGIFTIACESTLSRESQETVAAITESRISREKRPHWRRGHWRKVWGGRNNPEAPRIWIHPSLINKHRLPPHSLPVGSRTTLE